MCMKCAASGYHTDTLQRRHHTWYVRFADWSACKDLPAFDVSNRGNACRVCLQMEAESFRSAAFLSTVRPCIVCLIGDWAERLLQVHLQQPRNSNLPG